MRKADPALANAWRARIERQRRSGMTIAAFCAREGVSTNSFHQWKRKFAKTGQPSRQAAAIRPADFLALQLTAEPAQHVIEVELPNAVLVRLGADAPSRLASRMLRAAARLPQAARRQESDSR